ncbi:MAG: GntR family transcriptional regulator [Lentisphaerae bacterium]|jgi:DNA-binding transcriptional regulator YhcF (GntR family)|nr:GntR family transcriptional regulator [Lentisphaerota bacterium]
MLEILQERIESGAYPAGERLPSERKLAQEYGVPQSQVHRKLQELVRDGFLDCFRGNGYFVRAGKPRTDKAHKIAFCWESTNSLAVNENFYTDLLVGMASEYALSLNIFSVPDTAEEQNELFLQLINEGFEGIFCFPHLLHEYLPVFSELRKLGIPLIFWDYSPFPGIFPAVGVDHFSSCFTAATVLSGLAMPVTYIGYEDAEQNVLKLKGFEAGCACHGVTIDNKLLVPYRLAQVRPFPQDYFVGLAPHKLYFTATRNLTEFFVGAMFDQGYFPGKDYLLLAVDRLQIMEGSTFQLDCMMRDRAAIIRKFLLEMKNSVDSNDYTCNDYRIAMRYIKGRSLRGHGTGE